jgi:hypothetical protein
MDARPSGKAVSDALLQMPVASTDIQGEYGRLLTPFWIGKYANDIWTIGAIATPVSV